MKSPERKNRWFRWAFAAFAAAGAAWFFFAPPASDTTDAGKSAPASSATLPTDAETPGPSAPSPSDGAEKSSPAVAAGEDDRTEEEDQQTEEEKREAEEERLVEAFDGLTDTWQEPAKRQLEMSDVDAFVKAFRAVPEARKDECIHRALNLIPDENVMLLAGVLMDRSMDKEIVEDVYNDILNRDEDVKRPILQQIFKDKTHPCWTDTAWILDVTGDLPQTK